MGKRDSVSDRKLGNGLGNKLGNAAPKAKKSQSRLGNPPGKLGNRLGNKLVNKWDDSLGNAPTVTNPKIIKATILKRMREDAKSSAKILSLELSLSQTAIEARRWHAGSLASPVMRLGPYKR